MSEYRPDFAAPLPDQPADSTYSPVPGNVPPPTPAYVATGELAINLKKPFGSMGMISPALTIDGYPVNATWGRTVVAAPAGQRQVAVSVSYLWTYGRAVLPATVEPGRTTEVFYSSPWLTFMAGAIGLTPQKKPGGTVLIVLLAILGLLVVLAIAGAVLANS